MKNHRTCGLLVTFLVCCLSASTWADTVVISEFMARNDDLFVDADGEFSDWIELYNAGDTDVSLEGWSLTDDATELEKWKFPAVTLRANTFLLVFASGKDRTDPAGELHASFKLSSGGEYLALVDADGVIANEFKPEYGAQVPYASHGVDMGSEVTPLMVAGAMVRYHVPTDGGLGLSWVEREFDDSAWASGPTGIGFDQKRTPTYTDLIATDIGEQMRRVNPSVYLRIPFTVDDPSGLSALLLHAKYEDGMVLWVNGTEVRRINLRGDELDWDSKAGAPRPDDEGVVSELINLSAALELLEPGDNLLAIQGLNSSNSNSDLLILPELESVRVGQVSPGTLEYFPVASPGWPNGDGVSGIAEPPEFSRAGGAFTEAFALEITARGQGAEVRYTINQADPTESSLLYSGPVTVDTTAIIRARVFRDGFIESPVVEASFVMIDPELATKSSNLPVFIINTFGGSIVKDRWTKMHMQIIDRGDDGRARLDAEPHFTGTGVIQGRGSSTAGRQKSSMTFEIQDERGRDRDVELLGFPADSDWVLYGAYNFDQALVRNAFIYEISNQVGRYAVRTRPCEVYLNKTRGPVTEATYWGVYSFMEKIKRGEERVNIERIRPEHNEEPEVSGGYIMKIDRTDAGDAGFSAGGQTLRWVEPKESEVTPAQRTWVSSYAGRMNQAIRSGDMREYEKWIDVDSWIDHHILNVFPKNVDAFRLSGYMYKDREKRWEMGPIWDYDRTMGSTDGRDRVPEAWEGGTDYFGFGWYGPLFNRQPAKTGSEWDTRYLQRWNELRGSHLSTENVMSVVDEMAAEIGESADRNWVRWRQGSRDYLGANGPVEHLKDWLLRRLNWMDSQFTAPPAFSERGGPKDEPFELVLSTINGEVWYTRNGPDPRLANGTTSPDAVQYTAPILISENTRIRARSRVEERTWSEVVEETWYYELEPLVITEIMYNPEGGSDHEFLELQNVGEEPLDLNGVRLVSGNNDRLVFDFTGSAITTLAPGAYAVLVRDEVEFTAHYGEGIPIAGEYATSLSNAKLLMKLLGRVDEPYLRFQYDDDWVPTTDGGGYSLVIRDPLGSRESWDDGASWRASLEKGGSPGRIDGDTPAGLQLAGDINQDRSLNITDAVGMLRHLFQGGAVLPCASAAGNEKLLDMNGDADVNLTDAVHTLTYLFRSGAPPALGVKCVPIEGCPAACE